MPVIDELLEANQRYAETFSPFIPDGTLVSGHIYEVETGRLCTIVPAGA